MVAASKPTSQLSQQFNFLVTKYLFGTLAGDLGCFPLDPGAYPPGTDSRDSFTVFGVWFSEVPREGPPSDSVSLPRK